MKEKIIFQKCNFNNIYFLFYLIFIFIDLIIEYNIDPISNNSTTTYFLQSGILFELYVSIVSYFLAIIPHFIRKRLLKTKEGNITNIKIEDSETADDIKLIYNDKNLSETNKKKNTILLYCIVVGILDFLEKFALILYNIIYPDKELDTFKFSCIVPFEIIFQFICSYAILKIHFYKLQYFSLFLNIGIFIILLIIDIVILSTSNHSFDGKVYIFYVFNIIFYSIEFSLGKKIILHGYISIYLLIIIKGFILLILSLLFSLIMFFINKDNIVRIGDFFIGKKNIFLIIAKIFSSFFANLFTWLIIDRFSPNYFPLSLLMYEFCNFIVDIIHSKEYTKNIKWDLYIRIFLYLVSAIGVIIHNEIVVINVCNLGSDTKYFLDLKVQSEELFANTDNPKIIERYETLIELELESVNSNKNETEN